MTSKEFTRAMSLASIRAGVEGKTIKKRRLGYEGVKARDKRIAAYNAKVEVRRAKARELARARREKEQAAVATVEQRDALWRRVRDARFFIDIARETGCSRYFANCVKEAAHGLGKQADSFEHWDDAKVAWRKLKRQQKQKALVRNPNVSFRRLEQTTGNKR